MHSIRMHSAIQLSSRDTISYSQTSVKVECIAAYDEDTKASILSFNYKAEIGKENFMWECISICPHRWVELATERAKRASHTTPNSGSE